jgi:hypothetical protein
MPAGYVNPDCELVYVLRSVNPTGIPVGIGVGKDDPLKLEYFIGIIPFSIHM